MCVCIRRPWCIADITGQRLLTAPAPRLLLDRRRHRKSATFPVYIRRPLPVGVPLRCTSYVRGAVNAGTLVCSTSLSRMRPLLQLSPEPEMVMRRTATGQRGSQRERCVGATLSSTRSWMRCKQLRAPDTMTRWLCVAEPATDKEPCSCRRPKLSDSKFEHILQQTSTIRQTCFCCNSQVSQCRRAGVLQQR